MVTPVQASQRPRITPQEAHPNLTLPNKMDAFQTGNWHTLHPLGNYPRWPYGADKTEGVDAGRFGLIGEVGKQIQYDGKGSASGTIAVSSVNIKDKKAFVEKVIQFMTWQDSEYAKLLDARPIRNAKSEDNSWKLSWSSNLGWSITVVTSVTMTVTEGINRSGVEYVKIAWVEDPQETKPALPYFQPDSGFLVIEKHTDSPWWLLIWKISNQELKLDHLPEDEQKRLRHLMGNTAEVRHGITQYIDKLFAAMGSFAK